MDGDRMKKRGNKSFWGKRSFLIAAAVMVVAAAAMTWVYMAGQSKQQTRLAKQEEKREEQTVPATEEPAESVTKMLTSKKNEEKIKKQTDTQAEIAKTQPETGTEAATEEPQAEQTMSVQGGAQNTDQAAKTVEKELHFSSDNGLNWPLQGNVILNYSMDQTVYFATLDQYKYNPAVIIAGKVNDRVSSAAAGKITDITTNEVTGCTVTEDLGDGYSAVYGQLKEVPYEVGDYVESGSTIGYVSEPTKYYSVEGSNLYFELQKDGSPIDPVNFFE